MIYIKYFLSFLCFLFLACDSPNPEPEKIDPIYADIQSKVGEVSGQIKTAEKDLEDKLTELNKAVPQTGQIKFAQKRVDEAKNNLDRLNQMLSYWELRLKSRRQWARDEYLKAYKDKKPWPSSNEIEEYKAQKKLEEAPKNWDAKKRVSDYSKPSETPKKEGGGHH